MPRALMSMFRDHYPGAVALIALAIAAVLWFWVRQETSVTLNAFFGWRQSVIVLCTGLVIGGVMAELSALVARTSPGETPIGSAIVAAIFALPSYALLILFGLMLQD